MRILIATTPARWCACCARLRPTSRASIPALAGTRVPLAAFLRALRRRSASRPIANEYEMTNVSVGCFGCSPLNTTDNQSSSARRYRRGGPGHARTHAICNAAERRRHIARTSYGPTSHTVTIHSTGGVKGLVVGSLKSRRTHERVLAPTPALSSVLGLFLEVPPFRFGETEMPGRNETFRREMRAM